MSRLYCGTCGWNYSSWRGRFYPNDLPQSKWLGFFSHHFDTVEINNSFYRLPPRETFEHWAAATGSGFIFAVKASRYLTHIKRLKEPEQPLENVLTNSSGLGEKRGPILYQFPPRWSMDLARLDSFLKLLPRDARHAFEFRSDAWQNDQVFSLLRQYDAAYCIMDSPGLPLHVQTTADFTYIRMHSGTGGDSNYTDAELAQWAERIEKRLGKGDVYIYFNNDPQAFAVSNAQTLLKMLGSI